MSLLDEQLKSVWERLERTVAILASMDQELAADLGADLAAFMRLVVSNALSCALPDVVLRSAEMKWDLTKRNGMIGNLRLEGSKADIEALITAFSRLPEERFSIEQAHEDEDDDLPY
jgi:hypothetical protein